MMQGYQRPADDGSKVVVKVAPDSKRLQLLDPFAAWKEPIERIEIINKGKRQMY
ncbi:MAG: hypothetical protein WDM90_14505 [Ferruginibacter sp.]